MKNTTSIELRVSKLEALKKSAESNARRITRLIAKGVKTKIYPDRWSKLAKNYESEINQLINQ